MRTFGGVRGDVERAVRDSSDWVECASTVSELLERVIPHDRACWHPVDPGTCLITGSVARNIECSGSWFAEHEYVIDDYVKFVDLARGPTKAASLVQATRGDLSRSARARSSAEMGEPMGDELRAARQ